MMATKLMALMALMGLLSMSMFVGCSGASSVKVYPAGGTITYDGKPLEGATVMFVPAKGAPSDGTTDASGKYTIKTNGKPGAPVGSNKVMVSKAPAGIPSNMPANPTPDDMKLMMQKGGKPLAAKSEIPEKYSQVEGSGLSADVTSNASQNVFDFDLKD